MKLLFDENLSPKLVARVASEYPSSRHVEDLGLRGQSDQAIWDAAKAQGFVIVSKDNDFRQLAFLDGPPPKAIWLSVGNAGTVEVAALLIASVGAVAAFCAAPDESLLVLQKNASP